MSKNRAQVATPEMQSAFTLGLSIAEHVYGVPPGERGRKVNELIDTLRQIAEGNLTLMDTPEEMAAAGVAVPAHIGRSLADVLRSARDEERRVAILLLTAIKGAQHHLQEPPTGDPPASTTAR